MKCANCKFDDEKKLIVDNVSHIYLSSERGKRGALRCPSCMKNYEKRVMKEIEILRKGKG